MKYTKGPYRIGKGGSIVSDTPVTEVNSNECLEFYGGHCICESLTKANAERIIACFNACQGITTEALEANIVAHVLSSDADRHIKEEMTYEGHKIWEATDGK